MVVFQGKIKSGLLNLICDIKWVLKGVDQYHFKNELLRRAFKELTFQTNLIFKSFLEKYSIVEKLFFI